MKMNKSFEEMSKTVIGYFSKNKVVCATLSISVLLNMGFIISNNNNNRELDKILKENKQLEQSVSHLCDQNDALLVEREKLEIENNKLQSKVDEAKPWFEMKEEERRAEEERLEKEREEQERKAREEQERKEKQGYETGITYSQLARTPDEYDGEKVKFRGKVIQVMESGSLVIMRLAVNGSYDNVMYLTTVSSKLNGERILEDDYITVYGISKGIHTYTSTLGASISIPSMYVEKIDR